MLKKLIAILSVLALVCALPNVATAQYADLYNKQVGHSLYLKIPFHQDKFGRGKAPIRFGYSAEYSRTSAFGKHLNMATTDFRAPLLNFEFTSKNEGKMRLMGAEFAHMNGGGLHLGQSAEAGAGGTSTTTYVLIGALFLGMAAILATSGEDEEDECPGGPATVGGNPIIIGGIAVCDATGDA